MLAKLIALVLRYNEQNLVEAVDADFANVLRPTLIITCDPEIAVAVEGPVSSDAVIIWL